MPGRRGRLPIRAGPPGYGGENQGIRSKAMRGGAAGRPAALRGGIDGTDAQVRLCHR